MKEDYMKYLSLDKEQILCRVTELVNEYREHGINLRIDAADFYEKRQLETWYHGQIASFRYKENRYTVDIIVTGDVRATLEAPYGDTIAYVKDKSNMGKFYDEMQQYIESDYELIAIMEKKDPKRREIDFISNNYMEICIYDNQKKMWVDEGYPFDGASGVLDIGYEDVLEIVDFAIESYFD